jgi:hypothetical protein
MRSSAIFQLVAAIDLPSLLSFAKNRISKKRIAALLPEISIINTFVSESETLRSEMEAHNRTICRGVRMCLVPGYDASYLLCTCPGKYAIQYDVWRIVSVLKACCSFGERVITEIKQDEQAQVWSVCSQIVILKRDWHKISGRMLRVAYHVKRTIRRTRRREPELLKQISQMIAIFTSLSDV